MFGYITPLKPELKLREYDRYSAYYCAVCRSLGRRYGPLPRLTLSYDSVFMALLFDGLYEEKRELVSFRCGLHPTKKRWTLDEDNPGVDQAADLLFLTASFKMKDDVADDKKIAAAAGLALMKGVYKKLKKYRPEECRLAESWVKRQQALEAEKCASPDRAAEPFAKFMEDLFLLTDGDFASETAIFLGKIGYYTGKWVYLIDALDDLDKDRESGSYNPLLLRFTGEKPDETPEEFRKRIEEPMEKLLLFCLSELAENFEKLELKKNRDILENIIYLGLRHKTEEILRKYECRTLTKS